MAGPPILRILSGPQKGQEYPLVRERYEVGKHESNDIVLRHQTVSRKHCELIREEGGYRLRDLDSTNGSMIDGQRIRESKVSPGAVLSIGQVDVQVLPAQRDQRSDYPRRFDPEKSYRDTKSEWEENFEAAYVAWLLERHGGNISAAARAAQMDRKYLYKMAVEYGIHQPRGTKS
jgi:pSer/pThr/pTyr-binding forkhead associated (FHA) protein